MKRILGIAAMLLVLLFINYIPIIEPSSSASTVTPVQGQPSGPIRQLPNLQSVTFHIQNGIFGGPTPFTFAVNSAELAQRRNDPLSVANRDFMALEAVEFDDVFYSDADGTFNVDGRFVTIESVYNRSDTGGMRLAQVDLNFAGGGSEHLNQVASFVRFGGTPGTERFAVDGDLSTNAQLGNTVGQTGRLRLTMGFLAATECNYSVQPTSASFPGFFEVGFEHGTFMVSAPAGCQWDVEVETPEVEFLSAVLPLPVTGSRSVSYEIFTNRSPTPRTGRINIIDVASGEIRQTFTVTQEGFTCPASGYSISPANVVIERGGGDFSFQISSPPGCQPGGTSIDVDWIRLVTCVDTGGSRICFFQARSNPGNFRTGTIQVSGQRFFVYQNPQGCPIELICAFFPGACGVIEEPPAAVEDAGTLKLSRDFRDVKLARTPRGQNYIRLYYQFSSEAVQTMLFNPMLMLRSREILERYRPALQAMVKGEQVALTRGDLDEIDSFLDSFAAKGGPELQAAIKDVCRDLRDPRVHAEFGITMTEGPKRQLPSQGQLQSILRVGGLTTLFGFSLIFVCRISSRRRRGTIKRVLVVILGLLLVSSQSFVIGNRWSAVPEKSTFTAALDPAPLNPARSQFAESHEKRPITFEANYGQADPQVKFISRTSGYNLYLSATEATMQFRTGRGTAGGGAGLDNTVSSPPRPITASIPSLRMKLIGAKTEPQLAGVDPLPGRINYFLGKDAAQWRSGLSTFATVKSRQVYPGVDLIYYGSKGRLEYDFIVAPGADPEAITLGFEGAEHIEIDSLGDLVLTTAAGEVRHNKPIVYQDADGEKRLIEGHFVIADGKGEESLARHTSLVTFEIGSYDSGKPLIIDPVLSYSTYLGGGGTDEGNAIAVDAAGNSYVAGFTDSINFPTLNASQNGFGGGRQDAFVTKLDPSGRMIFSTYLGGDGQDNATSIAVDSSGNAWLTGFTDSTNFPVRNSFQPNKAGLFNAFVSRLDPGGSLAYSTHLGGNASDYGSSIVIDASGSAYVAGLATSTNFPLRNPLQTSPRGFADLFVAKFNPNGRQLVYSTYLGGAGIDGASSIAVDPAGNLYVTGLTSSPDFRTASALQPTHRGGLFDAFVTKLNPSGSQLIYSTYLGGSGEDRGLRIAIDGAGNAYITGDTDSSNFPTASAAQATIGGSVDAFVAKLGPSGNQLVYSTYLGGSGIEGGTSVAVDASGSATVSGFTGSANFPTVNALQQAFAGGPFDGFVVKIRATGAALDYATYLGGNGIDAGFGVAADAAGTAYVMGQTDSTNFPTASPLQPSIGGGPSDVFVAKIKAGPVIANVRIQGKHVIVDGSGFERGAVITMDGQDQKTKFTNATSLKGKKLGRRIAPGQSVGLRVRNPDGQISGEFSFTRNQ